MSSAQPFPIGTSPLPAERVIGLEPMPREIKNPASSAGRVRPLPGALCPSGLEDGIARFSTSFYPVFVTNLTSVRRQTRFVRRNPDESEVHRHQESLSVFPDSSSVYQIFFTAFNVEFTGRCGNPKVVLSGGLFFRSNCSSESSGLCAPIVAACCLRGSSPEPRCWSSEEERTASPRLHEAGFRRRRPQRRGREIQSRRPN